MISFNAGQRFLVTGASSGIGRACALLLNRLGATVIAVGRSEQRLNEARAQASAPEHFLPYVRDLTQDMDKLPLWVRRLAASHGKLAGMLHSAGKTWNIPMQSYDLDTARQAFDLLCHAPLLLARGFADRRANVGAGATMTFIAAAATERPNQGQGMYSAAKAALVTAVRCMANELALRKIRANCISPGLVQTSMLDYTVQQLGTAFLERELSAYPLGLGTPEDVASLAVFLLSDHARWFTGQNIILTGGR